MNEGVEIKSVEIKSIEIKSPPILGTSTELVLSPSSSCPLVLDLLALQAVGEPLFVAAENALGGLMRTIDGILPDSLLLLCPSCRGVPNPIWVSLREVGRVPGCAPGVLLWEGVTGSKGQRWILIRAAVPDPSLIPAGCCSVARGGCSHVCCVGIYGGAAAVPG